MSLPDNRLGGCPRIGISSQIEVFRKNKHSHIFNIGVSLRLLTYEYYFFKNNEELRKVSVDSR